MKILLIEDDKETAGYVIDGLSELGHSIDHAGDGPQGALMGAGDYDIMIVDRMLPGMDGVDVVKLLRGTGVETPVLFLTNLSSVGERVKGLEAGGDDYLVKPFAFSELAARVSALGRRTTATLSAEETRLTVADLEINLLRREVTRAGEPIDLQPREYRLLEYLARNAGRVVTRTMLLEKVWDFHFEPRTSVVETHISRLRNKLDKPFETPLIHTIRGAGYRLGD